MKKKNKIIILIICIVIVVAIIALLIFLNTFSLSADKLKEKGYEIFGYDYCTTDHTLEFGGDALTSWKCSLCGTSAINPTTNVPALCDNCAKITGRCNKCGKLK